jgi:hypothetical protein
MRIHPAVSAEEALAWLRREAMESWGVEHTPELDNALRPLAEAMAAVSATVLPEEIEPLTL